MSTWGSYLASYVKKKPPTTGDDAPTSTTTKVDITESRAPASFPLTLSAPSTTKPNAFPTNKTNDGFQRANSGAAAKKLYEIPGPAAKEESSVMKDVLAGEKAGTNASRVAKMFGYAAGAYTASPNTNAGVGFGEKGRKPPTMKPLLLVPDKTAEKSAGGPEPPLSPLMKMVREANAYTPPSATATAETRSRKPPLSPLLLVPESKKPGLSPPLSPLMALVQEAATKREQPKGIPSVDAVLRSKKEDSDPAVAGEKKMRSKKDEVQDMLDFFASQLDTPSGDVLALPSDNKRTSPSSEPKLEKSNREEDRAKPKAGVDKANAMNMLDFFSSQLDADADLLAAPVEERREEQKMGGGGKKEGFNMLGFFSRKSDKKEDVLTFPTDQKPQTSTSKPVTEERLQPQTFRAQDTSRNLSPFNDLGQAKPFIPPATRKESNWRTGSQGSSTSQELNSIVSTSSPKPKIWSRQTSRTSSELSSVTGGSGRKGSIWSQQTSPTSSVRAMSIKKSTPQVEQDLSQIRGRILSFGEDDEQMKKEQERRDAEHERIVELQTQAQRIIFEKEEMERERRRMMEEQMKFEREKERIEEEAESMRKFVEDVERERVLDEENREKKRRRKELEEEARRKAELEERRRIEAEEEEERARIQAEEEEERRRIQAEEQERREAEIAAREEAERAAREMEKERIRVEGLERKKQYQAKEDLLAKQEADRLTAEMMQYEADQEADRLYYAEEENRKRDVARRKDLDRQEYEEDQEKRREVERQKLIAAVERQREDERMRVEYEAQQEARAIEQERYEEEQRRAAKKRADQLFREENERRLFEQDQERRYYQQGEADPRYRQQQGQADPRYRQQQGRQFYQEKQADPRYRQAEYQRGRRPGPDRRPGVDRRPGADPRPGAERLANDYRTNIDKTILSPSVYQDSERYEPEPKPEVEPEEEEHEETKEEKLAKAEEKIRQAFAGLAAERAQSVTSSSPPASVTSRSNSARGPGGYGGFGKTPNGNGRLENAGGFVRGNTTGGGATKLQKRMPQPPQRVKPGSVNGRMIGLPGGPRPVRR
ncbi:uncharacterized protein RAG0_16038 [Rhynchosporium agropyri]|uniref:Uncharacterized protein n=1 Tax=Rhynchosporium agropyri TaxID=914238 RepID=A0A1E1LNI6_9HELO|nr:uncharacterized protein RAG0_16038 [Rhynchosporium agropyri]